MAILTFKNEVNELIKSLPTPEDLKECYFPILIVGYCSHLPSFFAYDVIVHRFLSAASNNPGFPLFVGDFGVAQNCPVNSSVKDSFS